MNRDVLGRVETVQASINTGIVGKFAKEHIVNQIVHGDHIEDLWNKAGITDHHPSRIFNINVTGLLHLRRVHDESGHHRPV